MNIDTNLRLNSIEKKDSNRLLVHIGVVIDISFGSPNRTMRAYTEVWGKDEEQNEVPICWLSSIVNVQGS